MNMLKKILAFIKPFIRNVVFSGIFNVIYAIFNLLTMLSFLPILSILFKTDQKVYEKPHYENLSQAFDYLKNYLYYFITQQIAAKGILPTLGIVCLVCVALFFFKNLFRFLATYQLAIVNHGMINRLQKKLYDKLISLPIAYFKKRQKGDLISRMTVDIQVIQEAYMTTLESLFRDPITIIVTLIMMFSMSGQLTLFVFITLPFSGILISKLGKKLKANSIKAQQESGRFLSLIEETLGGLAIIKAFAAEQRMFQRFNKSIERYRILSTKVSQRQGLASPSSEFLGSLTVIAVLWFGGSLVLSEQSNIDAPTFFTYIGLFYSVLNPFKTLAGTIAKLQKGNAAALRFFEILEAKNELTSPKNPIEKDNFNKAIHFKNINFQYDDDEMVFNNFSLTINKGETVALVGASGSGKSTLSHLLMRFYDVNTGSIYIDDVDIKQISNACLRKLIGMVSQDSILFNDTVANNIAFALAAPPSLKAIKESACIAYADEFIRQMPQGYESNIGDGGTKLSGGQRQRISIARAVLKNPPIMVLDEATSALDTQSEKWVQQALETMTKDRTALIIAHRLSTIQNADRIIVLDKGTILEEGKHEDLMNLKGRYHQMVQMQQFES